MMPWRRHLAGARSRQITAGRGFRMMPLLLLVAGALHAGAAGARTLQEVLNFGELRIGIAMASPWAMRDRDGELIGYDVDLGRTLASDLGVAARFVVYRHDELVRALETDEVDLLAASVTITPERALLVNFSRPHTTGGLELATRLDSTRRVANLLDLDDSEYRLAVVANSVAVELAERLLPRMQRTEYPTADEASSALIAGDVDAYLEEDPIPHYLAIQNRTDIDVPLGRALLETRTGFAIRKGDADFQSYLDAWIVSREADTWLPTTHNYWFRSLRWQSRLSDVPEF